MGGNGSPLAKRVLTLSSQVADAGLSRYLRDVAHHSQTDPVRAIATLRLTVERLLRLYADNLQRKGTDAALSDYLLARIAKGQYAAVIERLRESSHFSPGIAVRYAQLWTWGSTAHHDHHGPADLTPTDVERQIGPLIEVLDFTLQKLGAASLTVTVEARGPVSTDWPDWLRVLAADPPTLLVEPRLGRIDFPAISASVLRENVEALTRESPAGAGARFDSYDFDEHSHYHGRRELIANTTSTALRLRFAIVSGASGAGKTSFLKAGVTHRLVQTGHTVLYLTDYDDAAVGLLQTFCDAANKTRSAIILDHLDRLLSREDLATISRLNEVISRLLASDSTVVLLAVREDYLGALLRTFRTSPHGESLLADGRHLVVVPPLDLDEAVEILSEMLIDRGIAADKAELRAHLSLSSASSSDHHVFEPFLLQAARVHIQNTGGPPHDVRGIEQALRWHLSAALAKIPASKRPLASHVLKSMVEAQGRKWVDAYGIVANASAAAGGSQFDLPPSPVSAVDLVVEVTAALTAAHVLVERTTGIGAVTEWTLAHDLLGTIVLKWRTANELERDQAHLELTHAIDAEKEGRGEPLSAAQLNRIERHWPSLPQGPESARVLHRSRRSRLKTRMLFASLVVGTLLGLGGALWQWAISVREREAAEHRRRALESLTGFMIDDLELQLRPIGRLSLLEDIARETLRLSENTEAGDSDEQARLRNSARMILAQVEIDHRSCEAAVPLLVEVTTESRVRARSVRGDQWPALLSRSLILTADCQMISQGDMASALATYRDVVALVESLGNSATRALRLDLALAHMGVADVLGRQGHASEAREALDRSEVVLGSLRVDYGDEEEILLYSSRLDNKIGELELHRGRPLEAIAPFRRALALRELQARAAPQDLPRVQRMAFSVLRLGMAQERSGDESSALQSYDRCILLMRGLVANDPDNLTWSRQLSTCSLRSGITLRALNGDSGAIEEKIREALVTREIILERDASNLEARFDVAEACEVLAECILPRDAELADRTYQRALQEYTELVRLRPDNVAWRTARDRVARLRPTIESNSQSPD